ncbi:sigma-54 dependent transcriptional regulator [Litoribacillus peritrichatus]|uniref:Sigma-54 dependent transcriptional regulator n=1 Tax=Litoribacillus peritrichatus TaxID=718191 RepID=A0ABP7MHF7_9GAMM
MNQEHVFPDKTKVLLVDDESAFCELCALWLKQAGYDVITCGDGQQAQLLFHKTKEAGAGFDIIIHDLALPPTFKPEDGLAFINRYENVPVVVLTGHDERSLALKAMELGAEDFIAKPVDPDLLKVIVQRTVEKNQLRQQVQTLESELKTGQAKEDDLGLVGVSQNVQSIRELVTRIAPTQVPVFIQGPSGTGKEIIANAIHKMGNRADNPFISVHCGAIPAELLESELFGYKKGAFTGADSDRKGLLAMAHTGTLFLDEIGEMPLAMQVKLLRVLQEGSFYPVGSRDLMTIDVRLVSATNRDLPLAVQQGEFRDDLYYRIKGLTVGTQSLEMRREDIVPLLRHFLKRYNEKNQTKLSLSPEVLQWFNQADWPGNVRELKNTLESAAAICLTDQVTMQELALIRNDLLVEGKLQVASAEEWVEYPPKDILAKPMEQQVSALEINLICAAMAVNDNNKTRSAQQLGITRQGLINKIHRYELDF